MDGWMLDGWMDGCLLDGWMDGWMFDGWMFGWEAASLMASLLCHFTWV